MKILAIMGSPKGKGSGYRVVQLIEKRMKAMGEVEFEYLFLKDANLQPCKGCFTCVTKGEDKCPLKDDRAKIEAAILASDGVILSTPGYVQNVSWLMKNFIDRFAYTNHRPIFHRQKVLLVANSGGAGLKEAIAPMRIALGGAGRTRAGRRDTALAGNGKGGGEERPGRPEGGGKAVPRLPGHGAAEAGLQRLRTVRGPAAHRHRV